MDKKTNPESDDRPNYMELLFSKSGLPIRFDKEL